MDPLSEGQTKQEARTLLRERFLRMMAALNGQDAKFFLHEKTNVSGQIRAMDINVDNIQVGNLHTPMGVIPEAVLRLSDTISISVADFKNG